MGAMVATVLCPTSNVDASASDAAGRFPPEEVAALVEEVQRRQDVGEDVPPLIRAAAAGDTGAVLRCLQEGDGPGARDSAGRTALHWAAGSGGSERLVNALLTLGAGVGARDRRGATPLHHAAQGGGSVAVACLLLAEGASTADTDSQGRTPLMRAAAWGDASLCQLLSDGCKARELDAADNAQQTALHLAAGAGRAAAVKLLVTRGASVSAADAEGRVPLHSALLFYRDGQAAALVARHYPEKGEVEDRAEATEQMVRALLAGADVAKSVRQRDEAGMSALTWALRLRLPAVAKALLEHYKPDYKLDAFGRTPLHWAARAGDAHAVRCLLRFAYTPWKQDMQGHDSLMAAVESRNTDTVNALLTRRKYKTQTNGPGHTALHIAVAFRDAEMTRCLLRRGAYVACVDSEGRTPLFRALEAGEEGREVWTALLAAGAFRLQDGACDAQGRSLLHAAAAGGDEQAVRQLLLLGASPRVVDEGGRGESPLVCALRNLRRRAAAALLERPHLHLAADGRGRTPLHWAATIGLREEARWLHQQGADLQHVDCYGRTPIVTAADYGNWKLAGEMFDWWAPKEPSERFKGK